jgi:hypothetical protein
MLGESRIISRRQQIRIAECLPSILKFRDWSLAFSNYEHGSSIRALYRSCGHIGPNVVLIKDMDSHIFGGFSSDSW